MFEGPFGRVGHPVEEEGLVLLLGPGAQHEAVGDFGEDLLVVIDHRRPDSVQVDAVAAAIGVRKVVERALREGLVPAFALVEVIKRGQQSGVHHVVELGEAAAPPPGKIGAVGGGEHGCGRGLLPAHIVALHVDDDLHVRMFLHVVVGERGDGFGDDAAQGGHAQGHLLVCRRLGGGVAGGRSGRGTGGQYHCSDDDKHQRVESTKGSHRRFSSV